MSVFTKHPNQERVEALEIKTRLIREKGGLYHSSNRQDEWMCDCGVFGKGGTECWCCGNTEIEYQVTPRFGGGAQNFQWEN